MLGHAFVQAFVQAFAALVLFKAAGFHPETCWYLQRSIFRHVAVSHDVSRVRASDKIRYTFVHPTMGKFTVLTAAVDAYSAQKVDFIKYIENIKDKQQNIHIR